MVSNSTPHALSAMPPRGRSDVEGKIADGVHHTMMMSLSPGPRCDGMGVVVRIDAASVVVVHPARPIGA